MFLHLSVSHSVRRGCYDITSCYGQHPPRTVTPPPPGQHDPSWTASPQIAPPPRQHHSPWTAPPSPHQQACGSHPTGMLSL